MYKAQKLNEAIQKAKFLNTVDTRRRADRPKAGPNTRGASMDRKRQIYNTKAKLKTI